MMTIEKKNNYFIVRDSRDRKVYKGKNERMAEFKYSQDQKQEIATDCTG